MIAEDTTLSVYLVKRKRAEKIDRNEPDEEFTFFLEGDFLLELIINLFLDLGF